MNSVFTKKFSDDSKQFVMKTQAYLLLNPPKAKCIHVPCRSGIQEVYYHMGNDANGATIFEIHGGCFAQGTSANNEKMRQALCNDSGCSIIGLGYRLTPDAKYPCQQEDLLDEIFYFLDNCDKYHINMNRIAIWGHSAGGNLACTMIWHIQKSRKIQIRLLLLDYPYLDTFTSGKSRASTLDSPSSQEIDAMNELYAPFWARKQKWCSPLFASDNDLQKFPPTAIIICGIDPIAAENEVFINRLMHVGITVKTKKFLNMTHGFLELWYFREWYLKGKYILPNMQICAEQAIAFLTEVIHDYLTEPDSCLKNKNA